MAQGSTTPPPAGDNKKTLRAMMVAALPIYLAAQLAVHGFDPLWSAALAGALLGVGERGWRLFRHRFPSIGWLLGGDGDPPADLPPA